MSEYFLVSKGGRILNAVSGDGLTSERAAWALRVNDSRGERVTQHVTIEQLRRYETEGDI